jgi:hypothetical protein
MNAEDVEVLLGSGNVYFAPGHLKPPADAPALVSIAVKQNLQTSRNGDSRSRGGSVQVQAQVKFTGLSHQYSNPAHGRLLK